MQTLEEAGDLYMEIRSGLSEASKLILRRFEARKFFRFGNSWRRKNENGRWEVVLPDEERGLKLFFRGRFFMELR